MAVAPAAKKIPPPYPLALFSFAVPPLKGGVLCLPLTVVLAVLPVLLYVSRESSVRLAGLHSTGSKKGMTAEKSKDCESAEGSQGVDREGTALAGTNATAVEKGNNEMRQDDATREGSEQERKQQVENGDEDEEQLVIEQPLLTIKEVFVYQVPPLRASSGHRAEEWGLANPVFTGGCWQLTPRIESSIYIFLGVIAHAHT